MQQFEQDANKAENELITRQKDEFNVVSSELNSVMPLKPKESSEILNLRKIEANMAKQKNYKDAHQIQTKINELEKAEQNEWNIHRETSIKNQLNQLSQRHQNELNTLKKRINTGMEEMKKNRSVELER